MGTDHIDLSSVISVARLVIWRETVGQGPKAETMKRTGEPHAWKLNKRQRRDTIDVECFNYHKRGHYAARCPNNAMFCSGKRRDISRETEVTNVNHNRTEIIGEVFEVQVAVANRLPVAMLLGTDVPHLQRLLGGKWMEPFHGSWPEEDALVVTRVGRRRQMEEEIDLLQKDHNSEAKVRSLKEPTASEDGSKSIGELAELEGQQGDTSFQSYCLPSPMICLRVPGGRERGHLTRKQKREDKKRHATNETEEEEPLKHALDMSAEELQTLQETDTSLEAVRRASQGHPSSAGVGFFQKAGLI